MKDRKSWLKRRGNNKSSCKMALVVFLLALGMTQVASTRSEMALTNITRFNFGGGDLFTIPGTDCGLTRCMEVSHGTAMSTMGAGGDCVCQCHIETPAFREDQRICVNNIDECHMASFGRGATKPLIPFVFLPMKGQIIYPTTEIVFTDVDEAMCVVTSAQYLTATGWMTLRDVIDNDVPFGLYRDEGKTFLQWRGSSTLHSRLEGRLVAAHVLCSAQNPARLASSCAAFRIAGTSRNSLLDVRSIPFHAGEIVPSELSSQNQGLSVLECLAIGVCVLMLIFVYAAGIVFYIHYKQRQKQKDKDPEMNNSNTMSSENGSSIESRIDMDNVLMKTNPLLGMEGLSSDFLNDAGLSDVSERTEETRESSPSSNNQKFQKANSNVISAMVHSRRKKPTRPSVRSRTPENIHERLQRRSASPDFERAPHSELSIVDCSVENDGFQEMETSNAEPAIRRKLYFNPVFFETEHLKNPPPAAVEFLVKIREVMSIAKEKMTSKRFIPILYDIPEEENYHSVDLGWDIPCARRGRRFSVISLKRENSRRAGHCGGCPGCDINKVKEIEKKFTLTRSNSCKSCVSDDYKQNIVRKWLDEVPSLTQPIKSVAKVSGTPRPIEPKQKESTPPSLVNSTLRGGESNSKEEMDLKAIKTTETKTKTTMETKIYKPIETKVLKPAEHKLEKSTVNIITKPIEAKTGKIAEIKPVQTTENKLGKTNETIAKELKDIALKALPTPASKLALIEKRKLDIQVITNDIIDDKLKAVPIQNNNNIKTENISPKNINNATRRVRKKLPPPPPPPIPNSTLIIESPKTENVPVEVKKKMEAVIKELHKCARVEPRLLQEIKTETVAPIVAAPKIVIPVLAADNQYYSDDNMLSEHRKREVILQRENYLDLDSLERIKINKRRFSVACGPEIGKSPEIRDIERQSTINSNKEKLSRSWRDVRKAVEAYTYTNTSTGSSEFENRSLPVSEIFINSTIEPLYDNMASMLKPGPLTIKVSGSPVESRRNTYTDQFDPDTLDRKSNSKVEKRVDKILLKSGGSFKHKSLLDNENLSKRPSEPAFNRKIGSLREIYEAKAKAQEEEIRYHRGICERRASVAATSYDSDDLAAFVRSVKTPDLLRQTEIHKPPVPPKQRRISDVVYSNIIRDSPNSRRSPDERERLPHYNRVMNENVIARRSGRRSNRTRSRRTDLRKLTRTEDSGYLSTDSNESKRRANYLMQLKHRNNMNHILPEPIKLLPSAMTQARQQIPITLLQMGSDTDDMESVCDGRSESGGESIETDSVFFGNFDESKQMLEDLSMDALEHRHRHHTRIGHIDEQIDSGFMGETNIILSGDSDSEHRSVISIVAGRDGRASSASISKLDESPYMHSVELC